VRFERTRAGMTAARSSQCHATCAAQGISPADLESSQGRCSRRIRDCRARGKSHPKKSSTASTRLRASDLGVQASLGSAAAVPTPCSFRKEIAVDGNRFIGTGATGLQLLAENQNRK
jgi:hypothetical protein